MTDATDEADTTVGAVATRRPVVRLLGRLETVGAEDVGLCVDGVCVIPSRAREDGAAPSAEQLLEERFSEERPS